MSCKQHPLLSLIIPAYRSEKTIFNSLATLSRQTSSDYEIIVVDSSPDDATEQIVLTQFPGVRYEHSAERLLPHAARNLGASVAKGDLLLFSDPDIYADSNWVECLLHAHGNSNHIIVGAVRCYGKRWLDLGIHFSKYAHYLPTGETREIEHGATANLLCSRRQFLELDGFIGEKMAGDTLFCIKAREYGMRLQFEPGVVVEHHHTQSWLGFLNERLMRGRESAEVRANWYQWSKLYIWRNLIITVFGVRLAHKIYFVGKQAVNTDLFYDCLRTLPVWLSGEAFWHIGQVIGYIDILSDHKESTG